MCVDMCSRSPPKTQSCLSARSVACARRELYRQFHSSLQNACIQQACRDQEAGKLDTLPRASEIRTHFRLVHGALVHCTQGEAQVWHACVMILFPLFCPLSPRSSCCCAIPSPVCFAAHRNGGQLSVAAYCTPNSRATEVIATGSYNRASDVLHLRRSRSRFFCLINIV